MASDNGEQAACVPSRLADLAARGSNLMTPIINVRRRAPSPNIGDAQARAIAGGPPGRRGRKKLASMTFEGLARDAAWRPPSGDDCRRHRHGHLVAPPIFGMMGKRGAMDPSAPSSFHAAGTACAPGHSGRPGATGHGGTPIGAMDRDLHAFPGPRNFDRLAFETKDTEIGDG